MTLVTVERHLSKTTLHSDWFYKQRICLYVHLYMYIGKFPIL